MDAPRDRATLANHLRWHGALVTDLAPYDPIAAKVALVYRQASGMVSPEADLRAVADTMVTAGAAARGLQDHDTAALKISFAWYSAARAVHQFLTAGGA